MLISVVKYRSIVSVRFYGRYCIYESHIGYEGTIFLRFQLVHPSCRVFTSMIQEMNFVRSLLNGLSGLKVSNLHHEMWVTLLSKTNWI